MAGRYSNIWQIDRFSMVLGALLFTQPEQKTSQRDYTDYRTMLSTAPSLGKLPGFTQRD